MKAHVRTRQSVREERSIKSLLRAEREKNYTEPTGREERSEEENQRLRWEREREGGREARKNVQAEIAFLREKKKERTIDRSEEERGGNGRQKERELRERVCESRHFLAQIREKSSITLSIKHQTSSLLLLSSPLVFSRLL